MSTELRALIERKVINRDYSKNPFITNKQEGWIFDFKSVLLVPAHLELLTEALWKCIAHKDNYQIAGLESAAIPLITSLVQKAHKAGKSVNGFYIRKSRNKSGLHKHIEGTLTDDPVVLVDDLMNSSGSIMRQVEVLEEVGKQVSDVLVLVRFRALENYTYLQDRQINIHSPFTLSDFDLTIPEQPQPKQNPHQRIWTYDPGPSSYMHVLTRSTPALDGERLYFGADSGHFRALDTRSGTPIWELRVGHHVQFKSIFSTPVVHGGLVFFGSYDGTCYALDKNNGTPHWVFREADCIGSSPSVAADLKLLFIGLEHGHPTQHGSLVALDLMTGEKKWSYAMSAFTHASPLYVQQHGQVFCGGNEGIMYAFDAATGELLWKFETVGGRQYTGTGGFSPGDIKLAPAYDTDHDRIVFSSMDGYVYVVDRRSGELVFQLHTDEYDTVIKAGVFGSPLCTKDTIVFGGLDKHVYCYNKADGTLRWKYATAARVFATPTLIGEEIFIGSNDGRLYQLALDSGQCTALTQFSERITNPVVLDTDGKTLYVTTNTNHIHALRLATTE